jgi:hypothetical protein
VNERAPEAAARRAILAGLACLPFAGTARAALPSFPEDCSLLVAGPDDGLTASRGRLLAQQLQPAAALRLTAVGGADGVTAANQFVARAPRDGSVALLTPGMAAIAALAGEPRARFDAGDWLPVLAGVSPGLLASRVALRPGQRLRLAAAGPAGVELSGLMAAEMLGLAVEPVFGLAERDAAAAALLAGAVDAVFVCGPGGVAHARALATAGVSATFGLGLPDAAGVWRRDLALGDLPAVSELIEGRTPPAALVAAFGAAAVAAQIEYALVLPPLTSAALVAQWRQAAEGAATSLPLRQAEPDVRPLAGADAQAAIGALKLAPAAIQALRQWLVAAAR